MFYLYAIINEKSELYFGSTKDLRRRLVQHNQGKTFSTYGHKWKLVYYEAYFSEADVRVRERKLKHYGQSIKHLKNRLKNSLSEISAG